MGNSVRNRKTSGRSGQDCKFLREDILEAYLLGRLPGQQHPGSDDSEVRRVEEHLLWCDHCQETAQAQERELAALRQALEAYPHRAAGKQLALALTIR